MITWMSCHSPHGYPSVIHYWRDILSNTFKVEHSKDGRGLKRDWFWQISTTYNRTCIENSKDTYIWLILDNYTTNVFDFSKYNVLRRNTMKMQWCNKN